MWKEICRESNSGSDQTIKPSVKTAIECKIPDVQFKTDTWAARNRQESHDTCSGPVHFPYWPSGPCALCHDGECDWHSLESDEYNDCKDKRERRGQKGEKKKKEGWERRDGGGELVTGRWARERNNPDKRDGLIRGWWNETSDNGESPAVTPRRTIAAQPGGTHHFLWGRRRSHVGWRNGAKGGWIKWSRAEDMEMIRVCVFEREYGGFWDAISIFNTHL